MEPKHHTTHVSNLLNPHPTTTTINNHVHPLFRSAYLKHIRFPQDFTAGGRTKQSFKDECDINIIMARYAATGILEHTRQEAAQYLDVSSVDYQEAQNLIASANSLFHALPSGLRARFDNDPRKLLDFVHDPRNVDECIELGFLDPEKLPPQARGVASPTSSAPNASQAVSEASPKGDKPSSSSSSTGA